MRYVGGYLRPGFELAASEAELVKMPGFSKNIEASRTEARRLLAAAGVPNLKVKLTNRTIANLFTGAGVYVIDQWRQIGVETEHFQANDVLYNNALNEGTFDVALSKVIPSMSRATNSRVIFPSSSHQTRASIAIASSIACSNYRRTRPM
jgi:peptide/nickel transport system substrate-binding protein